MFAFDYGDVVADAPRLAAGSPARRAERLRALAGAAPAEQARAFVVTVLGGSAVRGVLERVAGLGVEPWALTAGCLFQTFWNAATGIADMAHGIRDHDLFFYDAADTSYEGEDVVIRRWLAACQDLDIELEPRNEARVHLWYAEKFGRSIPRYRDLPHAISSFAAPCCCVGLSLSTTGVLHLIAPYGLDDLFTLTMRPNLAGVAPRAVYETKAARWRQTWPDLRVLPWPEGAEWSAEARPAPSPRSQRGGASTAPCQPDRSL